MAALIPLGLGLVAIMTASGTLALVSHAYPLSEIYSEMVLLMGLATGIDYSLFIITRYRGERAVGHGKDEAITLASGTSGKAVVFAGVTVLLAISGMFLVNDVTFASLALSAVVVVAIAIIISVTLLPALLEILGDHIKPRPTLVPAAETSRGRWLLGADQRIRPRTAPHDHCGDPHGAVPARLPTPHAESGLQRPQIAA